jgi:ATP-binding cassette subfamily B protein
VSIWTRRIPPKRSAEDRDCGPAAFASVAAHFGHHLTVEQARELVQTDRTGTTMAHICEAGRHIGLASQGATATYEALTKVPLPAIAHLGGGDGHFLVITRCSRRSVSAIDPSVGPMRMARGHFEAMWSGYLVVFEATPLLATKEPDVRPGRVILAGMRRAAPALGVGAALVAAGTAIALVSAQFLGSALGLADRGRGIDAELVRNAALVAALALVLGLAQVVRLLVLGRAGERWQLASGERFLDRIVRLPVRDFDERCVVAFVGRSTEIDQARDAVIGTSAGAAGDLLVAGGSLSICMAADLRLGLLLVGVVPVFLAVGIIGRRATRLARFQVLRHNYEYVSRLVDSFTEVASVKLHNSEALIREDLGERFARLARATRRNAVVVAIPDQVATALSALVMITVLTVLAARSGRGAISVGEVIVTFTATGLFLTALQRLPGYLVAWTNATVTIERVEEVGLKPEERGLDRSPRELAGRGRIEICDLTFGYRRDRPILHEVSTTIEAGEVVAFVGQTGSGKTSLAKVLTALYQPLAGDVLLDGCGYTELSPVQIREHVTAVFQDAKLLQRSMRENLTMGHDHDDDAVLAACVEAQALDVFDSIRLGLDANAARAGSTLSAGQLQRLAIARALLRDAPVLILDEATANLDADTERQLLDACLDARRGRTTILIAHRLTAIERADRVVVLADGRIVEEGTHAQLLAAHGEFHRLFRSQYLSAAALDVGA